ncbi:MAG TPA: Nramp family divalent metal transporter [Vicinamibacteria bacterium]|nr:Nramp family divalent metal transporter [Vicinamibacteria bacterium]
MHRAKDSMAGPERADEDWSYPESPPPPRGLAMLGVFGPGAILASATIGAGETILAVRAGAWGGYDLLWLILVASFTKSFVLLYLLGRYAALTGDAVARRLLELPGPRGWLLVFILVADLVPAGAVFAAIAAPCGVLITQHAGGDARAWAIGFALAAILVAVVQKYEVLEKQQVVVCLVLLLCVVVSTLLVGPDLRRLLAGLFGIGRIPAVPDWAREAFAGRPMALELSTVFGYTGNVAMGYVVYCEFVRRKGWGVFRGARPAPPPDRLPTDEANRRRAVAGLALVRGDLIITAALIFAVTAAFLVAGAVVLHPIGQMPLGFDLLSRQSAIFERISPALIPVYYVAILLALWGTLNSVPEIYARVTHAFLGALLPGRMAARSYASVLRAIGLYLAACSIPLLWFRVQPQAMMDFVGLLSTNLGVALAFVAALWLDGRLPPPLRASRALFAVGLVSCLLVFTATGVSAWFLFLA